MHVEGVDLTELADAVGTPFYCYSARSIADAYTRWRAAFEAAGFAADRHRTCFAVKANSALAVLRHLRGMGADFDVVSAGELHRVRAAGAIASGVVFSGPGKSREELRLAVAAGVGLINVEAPGEIDCLRELSRSEQRPIRIGLRVNPDLDPETHPAISTGPRQTKFGLAPEEVQGLLDGDVFGELLQVGAIAVHIGSQVMQLSPMAEAARQALVWAQRFRDAGQPVAWIDIGGGLAIPYEEGVQVPTPEAFAQRIGEALSGWDGGLITEPGRIIVGPAGWLVTRVTAVRRRSERGLLVCDAGMNALLRPALYGARHTVVGVVDGQDVDSAQTWDVVGPLCESGDILARGARIGGAGAGSLLVVRDVGAYGFVMSSEYNSHPRPAQVWIDADRWAIVTPRLSFDEMLERERLAPWQADTEVPV